MRCSMSRSVHVFTAHVHKAEALVRGGFLAREHPRVFTTCISAGQSPCSRVHSIEREASVNAPLLRLRDLLITLQKVCRRESLGCMGGTADCIARDPEGRVRHPTCAASA